MNEKYFSNTKESLQIFREVIIPYLVKKRLEENRMDFVRRIATTSKVEIPEVAKKEAEATYLHKI